MSCKNCEQLRRNEHLGFAVGQLSTHLLQDVCCMCVWDLVWTILEQPLFSILHRAKLQRLPRPPIDPKTLAPTGRSRENCATSRRASVCVCCTSGSSSERTGKVLPWFVCSQDFGVWSCTRQIRESCICHDMLGRHCHEDPRMVAVPQFLSPEECLAQPACLVTSFQLAGLF